MNFTLKIFECSWVKKSMETATRFMLGWLYKYLSSAEAYKHATKYLKQAVNLTSGSILRSSVSSVSILA